MGHKDGLNMSKMRQLWQFYGYSKLYRDLESFKKFFYFFSAKKSVFLSFWSRSIDFIDFRVDKLRDKSRLGRHYKVSPYSIYRVLQNALRARVQKIFRKIETFQIPIHLIQGDYA